jgi:hypothetical protein
MREKEENENSKKLNTFTKIGIVIIAASVIALYFVISASWDLYVKAAVVLALIGIIIKLTERVFIDIYDMWHIFDFWENLRR